MTGGRGRDGPARPDGTDDGARERRREAGWVGADAFKLVKAWPRPVVPFQASCVTFFRHTFSICKMGIIISTSQSFREP